MKLMGETKTLMTMANDNLEKAIADVIHTLNSFQSWVIFSHQKLDGDALGSANALFEAGVMRGKRVRWIVPDPVPPAYSFLPHAADCECRGDYRFESGDDLHIFLDSANEDRSVRGFQRGAAGVTSVNIDHHQDNSNYCTVNCVDDSSSSASELLWLIMSRAGWHISKTIAECLYTGIVTDTGSFAFSNTTPRTHRAAGELIALGVEPSRIDGFVRQNHSLNGMYLWGRALARIVCWGEDGQFALSWLTQEDFRVSHAIPSDTEALVGQLMMIRGVRFAVLLTEGREGGPVKVSFRSKEDMVEASTIAHLLGGGGHPRASGTTLDMAIEPAVRKVRETLERAYAEWTAAVR